MITEVLTKEISDIEILRVRQKFMYRTTRKSPFSPPPLTLSLSQPLRSLSFSFRLSIGVSTTLSSRSLFSPLLASCTFPLRAS